MKSLLHEPLIRMVWKAEWRRWTMLTVLGLLISPVADAGAPAPETSPWRTTITAAYAGIGDAGLDDGGEFSVDRGVFSIETARRMNRQLFLGVSLDIGEDRYRFSGITAPWGDIRRLELDLSLRYLANAQWSLFGVPILRYTAERGADLSDGDEYGLLAGASYRVSEDLTIGPGFGVFGGLGDELDLFPILLIDWRLSDTLSLETGRGLAATRGPGLALKWRPAKAWEFGLAARYEKSRFRLDDADQLIGQDRAVPVVITASWQADRDFRLSALAGVETSGSLRLETNDGDTIDKQSYDTAPMIGVVASFTF